MYNQRKSLDLIYKNKLADAEKNITSYLNAWRKNNPKAGRSDIYDDLKFQELSNIEESIIDEWSKKGEEIDAKCKEVITTCLKSNNYDGVHIKRIQEVLEEKPKHGLPLINHRLSLLRIEVPLICLMMISITPYLNLIQIILILIAMTLPLIRMKVLLKTTI